MGWTESVKTFNQLFTVPPGGQLQVDLQIVKTQPGIRLLGTEANAIPYDIREIAGDLYIINNALYNSGPNNWTPINNALPVFGWIQKGTSGNWETVFCAAGTSPVVFTPQFVIAGGTTGGTPSWGTTTNAASGFMPLQAGLFLAWGNKASVPADGSAGAAVTFSTAFPNNCYQVFASVDNAFQSNPWILTCQTTSIATSGFTVNVAGAPGSSTVTVRYFAIGD